MSKVSEHEFRLDIDVYPHPSSEMCARGYKGTVHFRTEMTAVSLQESVNRLISIYSGCKWFSVGGCVYHNGARHYVCFYSSERGYSVWYHDCVNGLISACA